MMQFKSCVGRNACRDDAKGENCLTCGRSLNEVIATRTVAEQVSQLVLEQDYENVDEFLAWLCRKVNKRVSRAREENSINSVNTTQDP